MRIFYDHQIFEHQQYGGISRYYAQLISQMQSRSDISYMLPILRSSNHYLKAIPELAKVLKGDTDYYNRFCFGLEFPGKWKLYQKRNQLFPDRVLENRKYVEKKLKEGAYDLFHPTDIDDYFFEQIGNRPFVVTIHDLIDEYFPEYSFHVYSTYKTSIKERLVKAAAGIIAVSNSTKHDILEKFAVDEKKIKVIYHVPSNIKIVDSDPIVHGCYFLYVGKRVHYKNFYFLIQALQPLLVKDRNIKIVCVGSPFNAKERAYFCDLKVDANIVHMLADDNTLGNLYNYAQAFIYPSLYEGFGIPILEAFECECPVMVSNTSSLPEVAGDAALYFNPKSIESIQHAFTTMLSNNAIRQELIAKGRQQLAKFSWKETADQTFAFYKSIA